MNKYYNEKDLCLNIVELANFVVGQSAGNFIDDLVAIEKASFDSESNSSFNRVMETIGYSIGDVSKFECFKNKVNFTVFVGGGEVNDSLLDLESALATYNFWKEDENYGDQVHICTIG